MNLTPLMWLLAKDLRFLRRSPFVVAMLVVYPAILAILVGVALTRGPDKPRVAVFNQVSALDNTLTLGGASIDVDTYVDRLFEAIDPVKVSSRQKAVDMVESGDVLAALVIPPDMTRKLQGQAARPVVDVYLNEGDPVKAQFVDDILTSQVAGANTALSRLLTKEAARYLDLIVDGGTISLLGRSIDVLGLKNAELFVNEAARTYPEGSPMRRKLDKVVDFAKAARDNLDVSDDVMAITGQPIKVTKVLIGGRAPPLSGFAAAVSVTFMLLLVTVLIGAGAVALEREANTLERLLRGSITPSGLVVEKTVLAAGLSIVLSAMLIGALGVFIRIDWARFPLAVAGSALAALAFAAMGVALGAVVRDVRASSLAAVTLAFPIAFLALVPKGSVDSTFSGIAGLISLLFPFRPTLDVMSEALYSTPSGVLAPVGRNVALCIAYLFIARIAVRLRSRTG